MVSNDNALCTWRAWDDFAQKVATTPQASALNLGSRDWSYAALNSEVQDLARAVNAAETETTPAVTAIYADRSLESYAGVLAALMLGHAYVPLNPKFPAERNQSILAQSGAGFIICADSAREEVQAVVGDLPVTLVSQGQAGGPLVPRHNNSCAYILFTSGSTGQPKGVPISHGNLDAYLTAASAVTDFGPSDRFSQNFDLTFDLSVHDMFLCWRAGGTLVVPSEADLERPADYVRERAVTCWFSVPSLAQKMNLQGALAPGALAGIRHSLFCGEALPLDLAVKWRMATKSPVENWYGPTEATIACMRYPLPAQTGDLDTHLGLTPIGACLPGMRALVLDESGSEVPIGGLGELYLAGPQVTTGYLNTPDKTAEAFVTLAGQEGQFYRTGDRVRKQAPDELHFVDRTDNQIKIRGYRVEIGEIEAVLRDLSGGHTAVVTPLPLKSPTPTTLVASLEGWQGDPADLLRQASAALPAYMVPSALRRLAEFPKNASGKVDRGAIGASVVAEAEIGGPVDPNSVRKQLIALARRINPALSRQQILEAPDLMAAGLDSLAFTEFTVKIEQLFGLELDQAQVAEMAEMPLPRLTRFIKRLAGFELTGPGAKGGKGKGKGAGKGAGRSQRSKAEKQSVHYKSRRTIECIRAFPDFVAAAEHPLALFFGSSGVVSGIDASVVERRAAELGHPVCAANLGMAKLSNLGTTELIDFVRDVIRDQGKEVAFAVYELDVMQLSTLPTGREIEVVKAYLNGDLAVAEMDHLDPSNKWQPELGGTVYRGQAPTDTTAAPEAEANWNRKREGEVVATYLGETDFVPREAEIWLAGAEALKTLTPRVQGFVHPINDNGVNRVRAQGRADKFGDLHAMLMQRSGVPVALSCDFDLDPADFRNVNHTNLFSGREKISLQLTNRVLTAG